MIEVERRHLMAAIQCAGSVVGRSNTIPVLDQLRVVANGALELSGTDLDMVMSARVPYSGKESAPFMLGDHRSILHMVRHGGGDAVQMTPGKTLVIEAGALQVTIDDPISAEDWPVLSPAAHDVLTVQLGRVEIETIARVALAMSREETRYYLNGVYFEQIDAWTLRATATDGHRLFTADMKVPGAAGKLLGGVIVPRRAIHVLMAQFRRVDTVTMRFGHVPLANDAAAGATDLAPTPDTMRIGFAGQVGAVDATMMTRAIDGTFPDYRRVIPDRADYGVTFEVAALRRAMTAVSLGRLPALKLTFGKDAVEVSSRLAGPGMSAAIRVPFTGAVRDGLTVGFNGGYILDVLKAMRGELVHVALTDVLDPPSGAQVSHPTVWQDPEDAAMRCVLMPMRV